jgi:methylenetetrahydrofolate--tRNA-(uracil-5-)-methyltransferase
MIGALCHYVTTPQPSFQPMKANLGLLPPLAVPIRRKRQRQEAMAARALADVASFLAGIPDAMGEEGDSGDGD